MNGTVCKNSKLSPANGACTSRCTAQRWYVKTKCPKSHSVQPSAKNIQKLFRRRYALAAFHSRHEFANSGTRHSSKSDAVPRKFPAGTSAGIAAKPPTNTIQAANRKKVERDHFIG